MEVESIMEKMGTGMGMGAGKEGKKCEHNWKIFNDTKLKNTGTMSFYCTKCLAMSKKKTEYPKEE